MLLSHQFLPPLRRLRVLLCLQSTQFSRSHLDDFRNDIMRFMRLRTGLGTFLSYIANDKSSRPENDQAVAHHLPSDATPVS